MGWGGGGVPFSTVTNCFATFIRNIISVNGGFKCSSDVNRSILKRLSTVRTRATWMKKHNLKVSFVDKIILCFITCHFQRTREPLLSSATYDKTYYFFVTLCFI